MLPTRQDIIDSLKVLKAFQKFDNEKQVKMSLANEIALEMFPEFKTMSPEEQSDIITMLYEDMSIDMYILN